MGGDCKAKSLLRYSIEISESNSMKTPKNNPEDNNIRIGSECYPISDIVMLEAYINYTLFYLKDGKQLLYARTIKTFEAQFVNHGFLRVHRSYIINSAYLAGYSRHKNYLLMKNNLRVSISRRRKEFLNYYLFIKKSSFPHIF